MIMIMVENTMFTETAATSRGLFSYSKNPSGARGSGFEAGVMRQSALAETVE